MRIAVCRLWSSFTLVFLFGVALAPVCARSGVFTVEIGSGGGNAVALVQHTDTWRYHKGTNAPATGWQSADESTLDASWLLGAGGFGYATDNTPETTNCQTLLGDMVNTYSTVYLRKDFSVAAAADPSLHLRLRVDFDDGFIAWLDGNYLTNMNVLGAPTEPSYTNTASASHESSGGNNGPQPAMTFDLGPVGARLGAGSHVLSIIGLNQSRGSSDFILLADLEAVNPNNSVLQGQYFSLVSSNQVVLHGTNTLSASTRVVVNGDDARYDRTAGTWQKLQILAPGMNRFFIAALDGAGHILAITNCDIVSELASTTVSGALPGSATWSPGMGVVHVTGNVSIPAAQTLSIAPGTIVLLGAGISIQANNSSLVATGSLQSPVYFLPQDGTTEWGELIASGSGSVVRLAHVETVGGRVRFGTSATGLLEDSTFRENYSGSSILGSGGAGPVTVRRIHVKDYFDINFNSTVLLAEDSLFENVFLPSSDAFEMSDAPPGLIVRRVTVRRVLGSNSDAMDFNAARNVLVDSCLMYDVSDKGISVGAACAGCASSYGVTVSNCLIWNAAIGSAVKDGSTAGYYQNTIVNSGAGLSLYAKYTAQGGHITNGYNNILWGNTITINVTNGATAMLTYSDIQGTNWPGTGNFDSGPLFVDATAHNFAVASNSPCIGAGLNGLNLGATTPVGGLPGPPLKLAALSAGDEPIALTWTDDADNESGFRIERSTDLASWEAIAAVAANGTNYTDATGLLDQKYYYRVCATNYSGDSAFSNVTSGTRPSGRISIVSAADALHLSFLRLPGVSYVLQTRGSLAADTAWVNMLTIPADQGGIFIFTNATPTEAARFYRVVLE